METHKNLLRDIISTAEERGAARERERYFATIGTIAGELKKLTDRMTALMLKMEAKSEAAGPRPQPKKRKVVVANSAQIDVIGQFFQEVHPPGSTVTIKNIRQSGIKYGPRIIAAACRVLASLGEIEAVGRKGYRLAQQKENGLDETALPSE